MLSDLCIYTWVPRRALKINVLHACTHMHPSASLSLYNDKVQQCRCAIHDRYVDRQLASCFFCNFATKKTLSEQECPKKLVRTLLLGHSCSDKCCAEHFVQFRLLISSPAGMLGLSEDSLGPLGAALGRFRDNVKPVKPNSHTCRASAADQRHKVRSRF